MDRNGQNKTELRKNRLYLKGVDLTRNNQIILPRLREDLDYPDPVATEELLWFTMRDELIADRDNPYFRLDRPVLLFNCSPWKLRGKELRDQSHLVSELRYWLKVYANVFRWIHEDELKVRLLDHARTLIDVMEPNIHFDPEQVDQRKKSIPKWRESILPNQDEILYYIEQAMKDRDTMTLRVDNNDRNRRRFIKNPYSTTKQSRHNCINKAIGEHRRDETFNAIWLAIECWTADKKPTQQNIADVSSRSRRTVIDYLNKYPELQESFARKKGQYRKQPWVEVRRYKSNYDLTGKKEMCKTVHKYRRIIRIGANCTFYAMSDPIVEEVPHKQGLTGSAMQFNQINFLLHNPQL
jgi:hypothetical protein